MNISHASKRTGLPTKTIRYYEDIGLIRPDRDVNGYRAFSEQDVHKLAFLGRARGLGFSTADCSALLALWEDQDRNSADVRQIAQDHLLRVEERIQELEAMRETLRDLVRSCSGDSRPDCPILQDLESSSD